MDYNSYYRPIDNSYDIDDRRMIRVAVDYYLDNCTSGFVDDGGYAHASWVNYCDKQMSLLNPYR